MTLAAYDFLAPPRIVFGWGRLAEAGALAASLGRRALLVCGSRSLGQQGWTARLVEALQSAGVEVVQRVDIAREPHVEDVDQATLALRSQQSSPDMVIGFGGGAALDLAKALAARVTNRQGDSVADYLEGVGAGLKLTAAPLPVMAIPTTAGTGSEATKNAVISSRAGQYKKSLRSDLLVPRVCLVDPELTVSVPASVTAHTGMDAVTQLIESYISRRARPIPQALAVDGLRLALPAIRVAYHDGGNRAAREAMSHAALLSGMALANSGLGFAHGVAAGLGILADVPHGLACAMMLPVALRVNEQSAGEALDTLAQAVSPRGEADWNRARMIEEIERLVDALGIPRRLSQVGVSREQLPALAVASRGNSMSGNPRELSDDELLSILEDVF